MRLRRRITRLEVNSVISLVSVKYHANLLFQSSIIMQLQISDTE